MNIGAAIGLASSAAGAPLSQTAGSETERVGRDATAHQRSVDTQAKSESAAGIGETEGDQEASERDADGRRLWEETAKKKPSDGEANETPRQAKDASGVSGNSLDLTG